MKHKGEAIVIMSGEHGATTVEDGDDYPDWWQPAPPRAARVRKEQPAGEAK